MDLKSSILYNENINEIGPKEELETTSLSIEAVNAVTDLDSNLQLL